MRTLAILTGCVTAGQIRYRVVTGAEAPRQQELRSRDPPAQRAGRAGWRVSTYVKWATSAKGRGAVPVEWKGIVVCSGETRPSIGVASNG